MVKHGNTWVIKIKKQAYVSNPSKAAQRVENQKLIKWPFMLKTEK